MGLQGQFPMYSGSSSYMLCVYFVYVKQLHIWGSIYSIRKELTIVWTSYLFVCTQVQEKFDRDNNGKGNTYLFFNT